jgi:hypothetical protein
VINALGLCRFDVGQRRVFRTNILARLEDTPVHGFPNRQSIFWGLMHNPSSSSITVEHAAAFSEEARVGRTHLPLQLRIRRALYELGSDARIR